MHPRQGRHYRWSVCRNKGTVGRHRADRLARARTSLMKTPRHNLYLLAVALAAGAILGCSRTPDSGPRPATPAIDKPTGLDEPGTPMSRGQVRANGITIAYESFGTDDRETVLLIMG